MIRANYTAAFAYHFDIRPWEWSLLTSGDIRRLKDTVDAMGD